MAMSARLLAALLVWAVSVNARAETFDLALLMQALAAAPAAEESFTEKKFSALLSEPVVSSGKLIYRRPDTVEKHIEKPRRESYVFVGPDLKVKRDGTQRTIALASQPLLAAFAASLRGVLGGDLALLRNHYQLALQGDRQSWRLDMAPIDEEAARYVQRITVAGQAGRIAQIEVRETSGDHSVLKIR